MRPSPRALLVVSLCGSLWASVSAPAAALVPASAPATGAPATGAPAAGASAAGT